MGEIKALPALLDKMWLDYVAINPLAQRIHDLFTAAGEEVVNDHIALRTFNHPRVTLDVIAAPFIQSGYSYSGDYQFPEKKLYAKSYLHPNEAYPKIFISELKLEEFSSALRQKIEGLISQIPA